jgi:hypothetical protein
VVPEGPHLAIEGRRLAPADRPSRPDAGLMPADMSADSSLGLASGQSLPRLVPLEELAERGLWTRDGAYRALRRSGLPYLLIGSRQGPHRRLHRRIAVSERVAAELLHRRAAGSRRRGTWTEADYRDVGLKPGEDGS